MKKGIWIVLGLLAMGATVIAFKGDTYAGREILTAEQRSAAMAELEEQRERRQENIGRINDQVLMQALNREEFYLFHAMREDLYFDDQTYGLSYTGERFARVSDYENIQEFLQTYLNNFVAWYFVPEAQYFWITRPFSLPFAERIRYTEVVMDDDEVMPLPEIWRGQTGTAEIRYDSEKYIFRAEHNEDAAKPVALRGEFEAPLPEDVMQFEFNASDIGKTIQRGGYSVTLRRFTEFAYDVEIQTPDDESLPLRDDDIVGEAVSPAERYVSLRSEKHLQADYYAQKEAWLDDVIERAAQGEVTLQEVREEKRELEARLAVTEGTILHKAFAYLGSIESARVTILPRGTDESATRQPFEVPFYAIPSANSETSLDAMSDTVIEGPVYHHWAQERMDLTAEEMQRLIRIGYSTQDPEHPYFDYAETVYLNYPAVQSQLFMSPLDRYDAKSQAAIESVNFYDAEGKLIEIPEGDDVFTFTSEGFDYNPQYFSVWPARVTAKLPVLTAPNIIKQSYRSDELPEGMRLEGNRLIVDYGVFVPEEKLDRTRLSVPNLNYFFAKDAEKAYLKQVGEVAEINQEGHEPVHVFYYYGRPETIEIWYLGETKFVDYDMDVELRDPPLTE